MLEQYLAEIDAMLARGDLDEHDHAMASARGKAAARRDQDLPPLPGRSRPVVPHARRRARKLARAERHETGMTRAEQAYRDTVDAARRSRDADVARMRADADRALAEGHLSATAHADTLFRLERLADEPVQPSVPPPPPNDLLSRIARSRLGALDLDFGDSGD